MQNEMENFIKNIKFLRKSNNLSEKRMADILKISVKSLNKLEKGIMNGTVVFDIDSLLPSFSDSKPDGIKFKMSFETDSYFFGKYSVSLESNDGMILALKLTYEFSDDAKDIEIPANSVSVYDWETKSEEEVLGYIFDRLKKAGINESLLMMAESYL